MLAKHKVGSSTLLTRSRLKPPIFRGLFIFWWGRGLLKLNIGFHLGCTFLDLIFDKIAVVIGLFDVLRIVLFQRLDAVSGLTGNEASSRSDRVKKTHVGVTRIVKRLRPDLLGFQERKPFALVEVTYVDGVPVGVVKKQSSGSTLRGAGFSCLNVSTTLSCR